MPDITSTFLGIPIQSPLILGASSLSSNLSSLNKAKESPLGALVLKSLFEEQILASAGNISSNLDEYAHPEAREYIESASYTLGTQEYLKLLEQASANSSVPVIASVNCLGKENWTRFTQSLYNAGAKGLELNIARLPLNPEQGSQEIEDEIVDIVRTVKATSPLPLGIKLGAHYTNISRLVDALSKEKIQALVLFNRFYQMDINIQELKLKPGIALSNPQDFYSSLRWISLLSGRKALENLELIASGGIHSAESLIKLLLAGAQAAEICSVLYKEGFEVIEKILEDLKTWMSSKNFSSLADFRGTLSQKQSEKPEDYERLQYIKALTGLY